MPELILQCDERWSFVGHKGCKYWGWIALDAATGRIVALYAGDRSQASARGLWEKLPPAYRDHAIFYTDFRAPYTAVIPTARHHRVGKDEGGRRRSNDSTTRSANAAAGWFANASPFRRRPRTPSAPSGPLCITITRHYPHRTTRFKERAGCLFYRFLEVPLG